MTEIAVLSLTDSTIAYEQKRFYSNPGFGYGRIACSWLALCRPNEFPVVRTPPYAGNLQWEKLLVK
jgi:hypothetical protein